MPIELNVVNEGSLSLGVDDLREGEVYRDEQGDWLVVVRESKDEEGDERPVQALIQSDGKWMSYEYNRIQPVGAVGPWKFSGPYKAVLSIHGVQEGK